LINKYKNKLYQRDNNYNYYNHPETNGNKRIIYQRDRKSYYGPETTFENIPKIDYKFKVYLLNQLIIKIFYL
jgi:hypothetical protein